MPEIIRCPQCERKLKVPEHLLGKAVKCPTCGDTFTASLNQGPGVSTAVADEDAAGDDEGREDASDRLARASVKGTLPEIIACPECEGVLKVPRKLLGQEVKCPTCGATFEATTDKPAPVPVRQEEEDEEEVSLENLERRPPSRRSRSGRRRSARNDGSRYRRPGIEKPGKVQAVGVMMLIGGILGILLSIGLGVGSYGLCCLWPGTYFSLIMGIMAVVKASQLLGEDAWKMPAPTAIAVMQIVNIINGDINNCVLGIISVVFLSEEEVRGYFRG